MSKISLVISDVDGTIVTPDTTRTEVSLAHVFWGHVARPMHFVVTIIPVGAAPSYVGSAACKTCHAAVYARWQKTPMANVVRDPKEHPEAIIPDLTKPDPLVNPDADSGVGAIAKKRAGQFRGSVASPSRSGLKNTFQV